MALQRKIDWSSTIRDMRADRAKPVPGFLASRSLELARLDVRQAAARHGSTQMALRSNTMALEPRPLAVVLEDPAPEFITFLQQARQSRILVRALPL